MHMHAIRIEGTTKCGSNRVGHPIFKDISHFPLAIGRAMSVHGPQTFCDAATVSEACTIRYVLRSSTQQYRIVGIIFFGDSREYTLGDSILDRVGDARSRYSS